MEKALSVSNQVLKIAELRPVDRWVIDLRDDSVPKREPDLAGSCVRGSDPVFAAMSPSGMNSRVSKRCADSFSVQRALASASQLLRLIRLMLGPLGRTFVFDLGCNCARGFHFAASVTLAVVDFRAATGAIARNEMLSLAWAG